MSSILASLDMSLDDIISKKKKTPDARPKTGGRAKAAQASAGSGPVRGGRSSRRRHQPYARRNAADDDMMDVEDDEPTNTRKVAASKRRAGVPKKQAQGGKKSSILSRLGKAKEGGNANAVAGTKILVKNLKYDILEDDVTELFSTVGKVNKAEIVYDRSGRSKGLARVWYARRADAEKAIKEYDGRTLDGQPMQISLDSDKNVRNGLFGTALSGGDNDNVKFNVNLSARGGQKGRRGGRGGRGDRGDRGDRGGQPNPKTAEDLDNEMDTYMKDA